MNEMSRVASEMSKNFVKKKRVFEKGSKAKTDIRENFKKTKKEGEEKRDTPGKKKKEEGKQE